MIQLVFDASDAREALSQPPVEVGYSQHEGAERAAWGDEKLERSTARIRSSIPAAGSHANFYDEALYLGSSAEQGVGCDDTRGPALRAPPGRARRSRATRRRRAKAFPWIAFEGRWGELQKAFFNGPTGPNLKTQWTEPIEWSEGWRDRSYAVPTGGRPRDRRDRLLLRRGRRRSRTASSGSLDDPGSTLARARRRSLLLVDLRRCRGRPGVRLRRSVSRAGAAGVRSWRPPARMYVGARRCFLGIGLLFMPHRAARRPACRRSSSARLGLVGVDTTGRTAGARRALRASRSAPR